MCAQPLDDGEPWTNRVEYLELADRSTVDRLELSTETVVTVHYVRTGPGWDESDVHMLLRLPLPAGTTIKRDDMIEFWVRPSGRVVKCRINGLGEPVPIHWREQRA